MSLAARTLQRVRFAKCVFLSDTGLCAMAEFLWLEQLDVSGCHRLTDDGLEVLSEVSLIVSLLGQADLCLSVCVCV
jgi:hypothetical protein